MTRRSISMHRQAARVPLLLAVLLLPSSAHAQLTELNLARPMSPDRCLRARPALTYSAAPGAPERGDSTWAIVGLLSDGRVTRPLLPPRHSRRSQWRMAGDTLRLRVSDGLVGWDVAAVPDSSGYSGVATYLTDVIVRGALPYRIPVFLHNTVCPTAPPA